MLMTVNGKASVLSNASKENAQTEINKETIYSCILFSFSLLFSSRVPFMKGRRDFPLHPRQVSGVKSSRGTIV